MFELIMKGGVMIYPIIICSILSLALFLERLYYLFVNERGNYEKIKDDIKSYVAKRDTKGALEVCAKERCSVAKMMVIIIENINMERSILDEEIRRKAILQVSKMKRNVWIISLCAQLSPLLGLLGTVTGMISAFLAISVHGNPEALASGIAEALITTAAGLIVAIPSVAFYNYLNNRIDLITEEIETNYLEVLNMLGR